jgi:ADP-ribosyl-[dinitrogen reductase] hydrolase
LTRTSHTHPLQIAEVHTGEGWGRIGITFCPGKKQPHAFTGAWDRDLDLDLDAVVSWGAAAVLTLVEQHELDTLRVAGLGDAVRARYMSWLHLPIADVSTPCAVFEEQWHTAGEQLRSLLRSGFNVMVHCKGGLGRAGMIAARLLVELGHEPKSAIAEVRRQRPGALETPAQERAAISLASLPEAQPSQSEDAVQDRALGAMLGLAVGDAIGTTLEFAARDTKPRLTDMVGGGPFRLKPGEWTDDTAMALALADSLAAHPDLDERDLMQRFVEWYRRGSYSCTGKCFDIGITTRQALTRFEATSDPVAGSTDPRSAGNGSLMRLAPVALRHWQDKAKLVDVAARQSRTTHAAPEAVEACVAFAELLADAIAGEARSQVLAPRTERQGRVGEVLAGSWRGKRRDEIRSSGYVIDSLEAALWCVGRTSSFEEAVLLAANLADDADTVAAITGQLAGALYGAVAIPASWLEMLAWRERLTVAARTLI